MLGISDNTNAALTTGVRRLCGPFGSDDLLLPGALFEILRALNENGGADAVYTDEDKVNMELTMFIKRARRSGCICRRIN